MAITINGSGTVDGISVGGLTDGCVTPSDLSQPLTLETAKSATGTSVDFTGIPSWVKRVTIIIADVSTNSSNASLLQFGVGGVIQTTNYKSRTTYVGGTTLTSTSGFVWGVSGGSGANTYRGSIVAVKLEPNVWTVTGMGNVEDGNTGMIINAGRVTLTGVLDTVRIQAGTAGTETFDAGTINILYEG